MMSILVVSPFLFLLSFLLILLFLSFCWSTTRHKIVQFDLHKVQASRFLVQTSFLPLGFFFADKNTLCANERILCAAAGRVPMFVMARGVTAAARLSAIATDGQSI